VLNNGRTFNGEENNLSDVKKFWDCAVAIAAKQHMVARTTAILLIKQRIIMNESLIKRVKVKK
jgi:hypothetical protein